MSTQSYEREREMSYNGWSNYETWAVKLWLDNEQGSCEYWQERAEEIARKATPGEYEWETVQETATRALADELNEWHESAAEEWMPDQDSIFADLLNNAIGAVEWREIAKAYLEEVPDVLEEA